MNGQTHHLPGRLRLRFNQLKHDAGQRQRVTGALREIGGVVSVDASAITGGMLIYYDSEMGNTRRFWDTIETVLARHNLRQDLWPLPRQRPAPELVRKAADGLADARVDKLAKRRAFALPSRGMWF